MGRHHLNISRTIVEHHLLYTLNHRYPSKADTSILGHLECLPFHQVPTRLTLREPLQQSLIEEKNDTKRSRNHQEAHESLPVHVPDIHQFPNIYMSVLGCHKPQDHDMKFQCPQQRRLQCHDLPLRSEKASRLIQVDSHARILDKPQSHVPAQPAYQMTSLSITMMPTHIANSLSS